MKQGFGQLVSLQEAKKILNNFIIKNENEKITLHTALNRVLAEDTKAILDVPHFRKAAMDGYAVTATKTFGASNTNPKIFHKDEYADIATGAPVPKNADAVLMVEYTEKIDNNLKFYKAVTPGENIITIGSDIKKDTLLFKKGTILNPRYIGVLSSQGFTEILVKNKPIIAYFSTGNEILSLDETLVEGKIYDINSFTIKNSILNNYCDVINLGIIKDDKNEIKKMIMKGIEKADIVLLSGGSSLGEKDYMVEAVQELGEVMVHGIAVKPGKPTLIGNVKGKLVIGLPGYPTSALSNFYILIIPLIDNLLGIKRKSRCIKAKLSKKIVSTVGRYEFLPVKIQKETAIPIQKGSSAITTLAEADGFLEIDENIEVIEKDEMVQVQLF